MKPVSQAPLWSTYSRQLEDVVPKPILITVTRINFVCSECASTCLLNCHCPLNPYPLMATSQGTKVSALSPFNLMVDDVTKNENTTRLTFKNQYPFPFTNFIHCKNMLDPTHTP